MPRGRVLLAQREVPALFNLDGEYVGQRVSDVERRDWDIRKSRSSNSWFLGLTFAGETLFGSPWGGLVAVPQRC